MAARFRTGWLALTATALIAFVTVGGAAPAALAHDSLRSSSPEAGSTVTELDAVSLTFSDTLLNLGGMDNAFVIQVVGPNDRYYESGCAELSGAITTAATDLGVAGEYTVRWQVVSADGHAISDSYTFDYAPAAAGTTAASGLTQPLGCGSAITPPSADATTPGSESSGPSGLLIGLLAGGGFIVLVGVAVALLIRHSRRIK
jgi:hypothetical protein